MSTLTPSGLAHPVYLRQTDPSLTSIYFGRLELHSRPSDIETSPHYDACRDNPGACAELHTVYQPDAKHDSLVLRLLIPELLMLAGIRLITTHDGHTVNVHHNQDVRWRDIREKIEATMEILDVPYDFAELPYLVFEPVVIDRPVQLQITAGNSNGLPTVYFEFDAKIHERSGPFDVTARLPFATRYGDTAILVHAIDALMWPGRRVKTVSSFTQSSLTVYHNTTWQAVRDYVLEALREHDIDVTVISNPADSLLKRIRAMYKIRKALYRRSILTRFIGRLTSPY